MRRSFLILCLVASSLAAPLHAQSGDNPQRVERAEAAFASWLNKRGIKGVMVMRRAGRDVAVIEQGIAAGTKIELASLSKAITGICAAELVKTKAISWTSRFSDVTGRGPDVTLAALITQSSGLKKDSTQKMMKRSLDAKGAHQSDVILGNITKRGGPSRKPGKFRYNNENYALAALMIEAASGQPYEAICSKLALRPAGVTGKPSSRTGAFLPWGGWSMTVSDYAKWHSHWFGSKLRTTTKPRANPYADAKNGINYGMGTFFRNFQRGNTFWHFGALCFPGRMNVGAFAVTWFADWTVVAAYDGCVSDFKDMIALDNALATAVLGPIE